MRSPKAAASASAAITTSKWWRPTKPATEAPAAAATKAAAPTALCHFDLGMMRHCECRQYRCS